MIPIPATGPRISVLGSVNMDLVSYVPTAPRLGETVMGREFREIPGGKGANQAVAAARAGGDVELIGAVGDDAYGQRLRAGLDAAGVHIGGLRTVGARSGTAHIVVDDEGGNSIVVVPGANAQMTQVSQEEELRIAVSQLLLVQLELPLPGVLSGLRAARNRGVKTVLTPAPAPLEPLPQGLLDHVDLLVPNEHEARLMTGEDAPFLAAKALLDLVPEVVITLGSAGCLYLARGSEPLEIPAFAVKACDTTGAGDTFVGALAVALGEGQSIRSALIWASAASAISVQRAGASLSMPQRLEIERMAGGVPRQRPPVQ
ncbi:ribokinase [Streptomyces sp. N35]|uniref:ribokinase n=1 Tax=Streptomyces sp. N35 TaxID=2795730 RepID=UPI0018F3638B|nr:ribokinase [Streptomyces sp. N35]